MLGRFTFDGIKYMQRDGPGGHSLDWRDPGRLHDALLPRSEQLADGSTRETGTALLRFRTFEDLAATA